MRASSGITAEAEGSASIQLWRDILRSPGRGCRPPPPPGSRRSPAGPPTTHHNRRRRSRLQLQRARGSEAFPLLQQRAIRSPTVVVKRRAILCEVRERLIADYFEKLYPLHSLHLITPKCSPRNLLYHLDTWGLQHPALCL